MDKQMVISHVLRSLWLGSPLLALLLAAVAVLVVDALAAPARARRALPWIAPLGCIASMLALVTVGWPKDQLQPYFFGALCQGPLVASAQAVILISLMFVSLISPRYLEGRAIPQGEYYALLLLSGMGMLALAASFGLLPLFLNLELLSIPLYILTGLEKRNAAGTEAAFKYFLLGSLASAFLLLGIAFVFGGSGYTDYARISAAAAQRPLQPVLLAIGFGLSLVGFGFKLTLAPFHMYAPDVYEGAPTPVAALIATGSKVAGFTALFQFALLFCGMRFHLAPLWAALWAMAALGMAIGNIGAVVQPNFKRMLAYSSIAHSSYALIPVVVIARRPELFHPAMSALGYYLLAYTVMTLLAFGVAATLGRAGEGDIASYRGLGRRAPGLAAAMALALISLVGIPPTIGFFGKLRLFSLAVQGGHTVLAIIGVLSSVASAYYYLRVIVLMYMTEAEGEPSRAPVASRAGAVALGLGAVAIFALAFVAGL